MERKIGLQLFGKQKDDEDDQDKGHCLLCGRCDESDLSCGSLRRDSESKVTAHYFCMLFAANLMQNGDEDSVLSGFEVPDIQAEVRRGFRLTCTYCSKKGATVGCCERSCRVKFHLPCGRENETFHQFFGCFQSFCKNHVPRMPVKDLRQEALNKNRLSFRGTAMVRCPLCSESMPARASRSVIWVTCCKKPFHFSCIQAYTLKAGEYHIRCPLCKNEEIFKQDILTNGVYIPIRDAEWELQNEFDYLFTVPEHCSIATCLCPSGSRHKASDKKDDDNNNWFMLICDTCGSLAAHKYCAFTEKVGRLMDMEDDPTWTCGDCHSTLLKQGPES